MSIKDVVKYSDGLICYIGGEFNPLLFLKIQNKKNEIENFIINFLEIFSSNFYFEIQRIHNIKISDFEDIETPPVQQCEPLEKPLTVSDINPTLNFPIQIVAAGIIAVIINVAEKNKVYNL